MKRAAFAAVLGAALWSCGAPERVPGYGERCAASTECGAELSCVDDQVVCVTTPCPTVAWCRQECSSAGECPDGCSCETDSRTVEGTSISACFCRG